MSIKIISDGTLWNSKAIDEETGKIIPDVIGFKVWTDGTIIRGELQVLISGLDIVPHVTDIKYEGGA